MTFKTWCSLASALSIAVGCAASSEGSGGFAGSGAAAIGGGVSGTGGSGGGVSGIGGFGGGVSGTGGFGGGISGSGGSGAVGGNAGVGGDRQPITIDETGPNNPDGVTADQVRQLVAGGAPNGMRFVYPYDGTVFPRGILPPEIMWEGGAGDAVYLHIQSQLLDYRGVFKAVDNPNGITLPQTVWDAMGTQTLGPSDPFTIELTTLTGTTVAGPVSERVIVAQATLKGSIYYNSYSSPLASMGLPAPAGAVLRIPPGGSAEVFIGGGITACTGCHSVSANGSRLMTGGIASGSYSISNATQATATFVSAGVGAEFSGLFPDGSVYATSAHPNGIGPRSAGASTTVAELHTTDTGALIPDSGLPAGAMMPMFSPDGRLLTFSDYALGSGDGIAVMDYDAVTKKAAGYREIYTDASRYAGWPFFLPDNRAIVFALGESSDFSGFGAGLFPGAVGMPSDLYIADTNSKTTTILARAMGFNTPADYTSHTTYLPFGAEELHQNYYPTVSPVAAGGYYWVFFDTVRRYGNRGLGRQLWGTAVTISSDGSYNSDPSHPAFYLPGQEFGTGNHRAFTALDPCRNDGATCETGIDCCSGFCTDGMCGTPPVDRCANTNETCATHEDCCNPADRCLGGFCGQVLPPD